MMLSLIASSCIRLLSSHYVIITSLPLQKEMRDAIARPAVDPPPSNTYRELTASALMFIPHTCNYYYTNICYIWSNTSIVGYIGLQICRFFNWSVMCM